MQTCKTPLTALAIYGFVLIIVCQSPVPLGVILGLFTILPFFVVWMVYRILKYGTPSPRTFESSWYEDKIR